MAATRIQFVSTSALILVLCNLVACIPTHSDNTNAKPDVPTVPISSVERDCAQFVGMLDQTGNHELVEMFRSELEDCARLILAAESESSHFQGNAERQGKRSEEEGGKNEDGPWRQVQRRAYDYIRFGKRFSALAEKRMTPTKMATKKLGTHEYIRFGKK